MDKIIGILGRLAAQFMNMSLLDLLDIFIVSMLFYWLISFVKKRRAGKLAIGIGVLLAIMLVSNAINLGTVNFILNNLFQVGIIAIIIIFQPEIRDVLERVGGVQKLIPRESRGAKQLKSKVGTICEAVCDMSSDRTGALIVIERTTAVREFANTGTIINADISKNLIKNIFFNRSPLHDGALFITDNRIYSAGAKLPLATHVVGKEYGTRHRAAIGMSEQSDAVVIVVSEETGIISLAVGGNLSRNYDYERLQKELIDLLVPTQVSIQDAMNMGNVAERRAAKQVRRAQAALEKAQGALFAETRKRILEEEEDVGNKDKDKQ